MLRPRPTRTGRPDGANPGARHQRLAGTNRPAINRLAGNWRTRRSRRPGTRCAGSSRHRRPRRPQSGRQVGPRRNYRPRHRLAGEGALGSGGGLGSRRSRRRPRCFRRPRRRSRWPRRHRRSWACRFGRRKRLARSGKNLSRSRRRRGGPRYGSRCRRRGPSRCEHDSRRSRWGRRGLSGRPERRVNRPAGGQRWTHRRCRTCLLGARALLFHFGDRCRNRLRRLGDRRGPARRCLVCRRCGHRCRLFGDFLRRLRLGRGEAIQRSQLDRHVFVDRAGVRLLFRYAELGKPLQNFMSFDFQLPCQLVDANLLHKYDCLRSPRGSQNPHYSPGSSALPEVGPVPSGPSPSSEL